MSFRFRIFAKKVAGSKQSNKGRRLAIERFYLQKSKKSFTFVVTRPGKLSG
jgi:hypothetical protein